MKKIMIAIIISLVCLTSIFAGGQKESTKNEVTFLYFTLPRETQVVLEMEKLLVEKYTDYKVNLKNVDQVMLGWTALENKEGDAFSTYTGTVYSTILQQTITKDVLDPVVMKNEVQKLLAEKGYKLLKNVGFENTYALAVTEEYAKKYNLKKVSDLVGMSPEINFACDYDFLNRDGVLSYKSMVETYGLKFKSAVGMDMGLMYQAINRGELQVILAYSSDGALIDQGLVCLEDDLHVFPPYNVCVLIRQEVLDSHPGLEDAMDKLADQISLVDIQKMNLRITADEISDHDMAVEFLKSKGLV